MENQPRANDEILPHDSDTFAEALIFGVVADKIEISDTEITDSQPYDRGVEFVRKGTSLRSLKGIILDQAETLKFLRSRKEDVERSPGNCNEHRCHTDLINNFKATKECDQEWDLSFVDLSSRVSLIKNEVEKFPEESDSADEDEEGMRRKELLKVNEKLVSLISRTLYNPREEFPKTLSNTAESFLREARNYSSK